MKLVTFTAKSSSASTDSSAVLSIDIPTPGVILPVQGSAIRHEIVDLSSLRLSLSVSAIIEAGSASPRSHQCRNSPRLPRSHSGNRHLHAPIPRPPRIFAIGLNYQSHAAESKMAVPKVPTVFMKLSSAVVGPDTPIILPKISTQPDYEAELAVVIGKPGYQISADDWHAVTSSATPSSTTSAPATSSSPPRSGRSANPSQPSHPVGPSITTADEIPDPHALRHRTHRQRRNPPEGQHQRPHLQDPRPHRLPLQHNAPRSRRHHQHRNPRRRRPRPHPQPLAQAQRRSHHHHRQS